MKISLALAFRPKLSPTIAPVTGLEGRIQHDGTTYEHYFEWSMPGAFNPATDVIEIEDDNGDRVASATETPVTVNRVSPLAGWVRIRWVRSGSNGPWTLIPGAPTTFSANGFPGDLIEVSLTDPGVNVPDGSFVNNYRIACTETTSSSPIDFESQSEVAGNSFVVSPNTSDKTVSCSCGDTLGRRSLEMRRRVLAAPQNVAADGAGWLTWDAPLSGATSYRVYRFGLPLDIVAGPPFLPEAGDGDYSVSGITPDGTIGLVSGEVYLEE
jgi:hypothetical protein